MTAPEPGRILCPWCHGSRGYWYNDESVNGAGGWYDCVGCDGDGTLAAGPYAQQQVLLAAADALKSKAQALIRELNIHPAYVPA